jgi:hypothetical protein
MTDWTLTLWFVVDAGIISKLMSGDRLTVEQAYRYLDMGDEYWAS